MPYNWQNFAATCHSCSTFDVIPIFCYSLQTLSLHEGLVMSTSWDSSCKLWDINQGICIQTLSGHTESKQFWRCWYVNIMEFSVVRLGYKQGLCKNMISYKNICRFIDQSPYMEIKGRGCRICPFLCWIWNTKRGNLFRRLNKFDCCL